MPCVAENLELKQQVLNDKTYYFYTQYNIALYHANKSFDSEVEAIKAQLVLDDKASLLCAVSPEEYKACQQIYNASRKRSKTLRSKINKWVKKGNLYFLTLTFSDEHLQRTSPGYRRQQVFRFLKSLDCYYAANIDFGDKNGREHYHAVICTGSLLVEEINKTADGRFYSRFAIQDSWEACAGFLHVQGPICSDEDSLAPVKLAKYVSKLSNHALKASALTNSIIYSRSIPSWDGGQL